MDDDAHQARRARDFRYRRWLSTPPPPATDYPIGRQPLPSWALHTLRRGEEIPGKLLPLIDRWYQVCPVCGWAVFLTYPWNMPAYHEIAPPGEIDGVLMDRQDQACNPIQVHPCRFFDEEVGWDPWNDDVLQPNMRRFL